MSKATIEKPQQDVTGDESLPQAQDSVRPRTPTEFEGLRVSDRREDPERAAAQKAALVDWQRRQDPRNWTSLPNGEFIRVQGAVAPSYPGEDATMMMANPRGMLLHPKPDYVAVTAGVERIFPRYVWRVRTSVIKGDNRPAETANLHRAQRIRYVETDEISTDCEYAVYTEYATANNKYVTYDTLILCEILDPRLVYQKMKGWEDQGIARASQLQETVRGEKGTHVPDVTTIDVKGPEKSRRGS